MHTNLNNNNQLECSDSRLVSCGGIINENFAFGLVRNLNSDIDYVTGALVYRKPDSNLTFSFVDRNIENSIKNENYFLNVRDFVNGFYIEYEQAKSMILFLELGN